MHTVNETIPFTIHIHHQFKQTETHHLHLQGAEASPPRHCYLQQGDDQTALSTRCLIYIFYFKEKASG